LLVYRHRQRKRRVVDVDAQLIVGTPDGKRDGRAVPSDDGMGYQVAGEQDRDVGIDRDFPGADDRADLTAGLGRRSRFPGHQDATLV
jgi:hypothetical protein